MKSSNFVFIVGQSGAGLGTGIRALEDLGFYCIDNLPLVLLEQTFSFLLQQKQSPYLGQALAFHVSSRKEAQLFEQCCQRWKNKVGLKVIYLEANNKTLFRRYSSTRRKHPVALGGSLESGVEQEKEALKKIKKTADVVLDTSELSPHELRFLLEKQFRKTLPNRVMKVAITSFGFKYGLCQPVDSLFDVRFLKNPYFVESLKDKSGLDSKVSDFVLSQAETKIFTEKVLDFYKWLLPQHYKEGKHYFHIGIGCTGGRHRSVCLVEWLEKNLQRALPKEIVVSSLHRDINSGV